jgi:monoterpene epsilon-lactone hydrolase
VWQADRDGTDGLEKALLVSKLPKMNPETRAIWLFFWIKRRLGLSQLGRPARPPARPSKKDLRGLLLEREVISGRDVYTLSPPEPKRQLVYLHGGGYVQPIAKQHWQLATKIAREADCKVILPLYGLAPRNTVDDALRLMNEVLDRLDDLPLVLGGDSAGGGLALALAQTKKWQSRTQLLLLISPWVEASFQDEESKHLEKIDPWLSAEALGYIAGVWSGVGDVARLEVSPLRGTLEGLPATQLFIGDLDLLYPQGRELATALRSSNVDLQLHEESGALHVYPLIPTRDGLEAQKLIIDTVSKTESN